MLRKNLLKSVLVAGLLALGLTSAAQAATYSFDLKNVSGTSFTVSGLTMTLGSATFTGGMSKVLTAQPDSTLVYTANGVGSSAVTSYNRPGTIDGRLNASAGGNANLREALTFTFSKTVRLVGVRLTNILSGSVVLVAVDSAFQNENVQTAATALTSLLGFNYVDDTFALGARTAGVNPNPLQPSSFYISSVIVQDVGSAPAVPLPAGGVLLGSLVVVPFLRRRKRAA